MPRVVLRICRDSYDIAKQVFDRGRLTVASLDTALCRDLQRPLPSFILAPLFWVVAYAVRRSQQLVGLSTVDRFHCGLDHSRAWSTV